MPPKLYEGTERVVRVGSSLGRNKWIVANAPEPIEVAPGSSHKVTLVHSSVRHARFGTNFN